MFLSFFSSSNSMQANVINSIVVKKWSLKHRVNLQSGKGQVVEQMECSLSREIWLLVPLVHDDFGLS